MLNNSCMTPKLKEFFIYADSANDDIALPDKISYAIWPGSETAEDKPIVMCVHGITRNSRDFDYLAHHLQQQGYTVIAPDVIGRGKSGWLQNKHDYNYTTYTEHFRKFIHSFEQDIIWVGSSMGGIIAMHLLASGETKIKRLILNDIGPFVHREPLQKIANYLNVDTAFNDFEELKKYYRKILKPFGIKSEEHWQHIIDHGYFEQNGQYHLSYDPAISTHAFADDKDIIEDEDLWHLWDNFQVPTFIIRGKKSYILDNETYQKMLQKPQVTGWEIDNVGHTPALFEQEQIEKISGFIVEE